MRNHKKYKMDWNSMTRLTKKICHNEPIYEAPKINKQYEQTKRIEAIEHYLDTAKADIAQFGEIGEITLESLKIVINGID